MDQTVFSALKTIFAVPAAKTIGAIIFASFAVAFVIGLFFFKLSVGAITAAAVSAGFVFLSVYVSKAIIGIFKTMTDILNEEVFPVLADGLGIPAAFRIGKIIFRTFSQTFNSLFPDFIKNARTITELVCRWRLFTLGFRIRSGINGIFDTIIDLLNESIFPVIANTLGSPLATKIGNIVSDTIMSKFD